jgi:hypothetical protein
MNVKHIAGLSGAAALLLAVGFSAGLLLSRNVAAPPNPARQQLMNQLVSTKAVIEASVNLHDFGVQESQLRAAADLADRQLNDGERRAVSDAIGAIHNTRSALNLMSSQNCHVQYDQILTLDESLCQIPLNQLAESVGLGPNIVLSTPYRSKIGQALLGVCLSRIQQAVKLISG